MCKRRLQSETSLQNECWTICPSVQKSKLTSNPWSFGSITFSQHSPETHLSQYIEQNTHRAEPMQYTSCNWYQLISTAHLGKLQNAHITTHLREEDIQLIQVGAIFQALAIMRLTMCCDRSFIPASRIACEGGSRRVRMNNAMQVVFTAFESRDAKASDLSIMENMDAGNRYRSALIYTALFPYCFIIESERCLQ